MTDLPGNTTSSFGLSYKDSHRTKAFGCNKSIMLVREKQIPACHVSCDILFTFSPFLMARFVIS